MMREINIRVTPQANRFELHQRPPSLTASYSIDLSSWTERCNMAKTARPDSEHTHTLLAKLALGFDRTTRDHLRPTMP